MIREFAPLLWHVHVKDIAGRVDGSQRPGRRCGTPLHVGAADLVPLGQGSVMMRSSEEPHVLILAGDGRVSRRREPISEPRGTQVRVRIEVVGICATDLALQHGRYRAPHRNPVCFGHEWAGVVEAVGGDVQHLRPGDRVTGECSLWCGACEGCRCNLNLCQRIEKFGITVDGAAREHILVDAKYLHRSVPDLDPAVLALAEPLAVCHQGFLATGFRRDPERLARMLIIGIGMLG